jgi:preprotein translocase subunit YajC
MLAALLFAADAPVPEGPPWWSQIVLILPIFLLFFFLVLRPNRAQEQQRKALIAGLKRKDRIINSGGIIGEVESVKDDDEVVLKGGLRITKSSITRVISADDAVKD